MEGVESKSQSLQQDSQITPANSAWLSENVEGFQQCVKEILKLIERDGNFSEMTAELYDHKKSELTAQVAELSRMHRLLADQNEHLIGEFSRNWPSLIKNQHLDSSDLSSPQVTQMFTPDEMSNTHKFRTPIGFDTVSNPSGDGFYTSGREGSESSLSVSSDTDSESFMSINKFLISPVNDFASKVKETKVPAVLYKKIANLEEELAILNTKLQNLADENTKLKGKIHENESATELTSDLQSQLEWAEIDFRTQNAHLEAEKAKVVELQKEVADLDLVIFDSNGKISIMGEELEACRAKILTAEDEISKLKHELSSKCFEETDFRTQNAHLEAEKAKVVELQKEVADLDLVIFDSNGKIRIMGEELEACRAKLLTAEDEISKLKHELSSKCFEETDWLQSQLGSNQQQMALLQRQLDSEKDKVLGLQDEVSLYLADITVRDDQITELNAKLNQSMSEISLLKSTHEGKEDSWNADIERLKMELREKCRLIDDLNKAMDTLKQKRDALMSEKDGVNAQLDTLLTEMCSQDNVIRELETRLNSLQVEHVGVLGSFDSAQKVTNELRVRVVELEREVDWQMEVLSDRAEEKREAIRQLSFSLEHYKSRYKELRQAFIVYKRHAVLTS